MRGPISDDARIEHIAECIDEIESAIKDKSFESFFADHVLRIAVVKWLEIIGEAARRVSDETKVKYPQVEWQKMVAMRNVMVHEYFGVNYDTIWQTVIKDLKHLKEEIGSIKRDLN